MKSLDETFDQYNDLRNLVMTQKGLKFKLLVSDGHSTYTSTKMNDLLRSDGTMQKIRAPMEPNQNPIAERRIRTNVEMARTMMIHAGVPAYVWEDATMHANYIRNRVITKALKGVTPFEKFWGRKPDLTWLKPFGCLVYVLIHKEIRESKFEASASPGVFIGISDCHSAYKIELLSNRGVKIARDVRFYEDCFPYRQNPTNDLQWLNPKDIPIGHHDSLENPDPLSEIQNISKEQELQEVYRRIPMYSNIPNAGIKRNRESTSEKSPKSVLVTKDITQVEIEELIDGYALQHGALEPKSLAEALNGSNAKQWHDACKAEFSAIERTGTFAKMTDDAKKLLDEGKINVHGTRSILKVKLDENGNIARYKVRLVIQGFTMQQGVDYDSSFAPCARIATVRILAALSIHNNWNLLHGDVPNAYLNGKTQKLVLVRLPQYWNEMVGYNLGRDGDPVICVKSLYGAPDAGRNWNSCQHEMFIKNGYVQSSKEPCIYVKRTDKGTSIFGIWVDDNFITGDDITEQNRMITALKDRFDIKILGRLSFALGINFKWSKNELRMTQTAYIERVAQQFRLQDANPCSLPLQKGFKPQSSMSPTNDAEKHEMENIPYREAIGSLLYIAVCTRPDIAYAVCALARFCTNPGREHWTAVKSVIKYTLATKNAGIIYHIPNEKDCNATCISGYSDSSFNDSDTGKSTLGHIAYIF
jgi:hypothetical protein